MSNGWQICRNCMTLVPPGINTCKCVRVEHLPNTQVLHTLHLPEGYSIVQTGTIKPTSEEPTT